MNLKKIIIEQNNIIERLKKNWDFSDDIIVKVYKYFKDFKNSNNYLELIDQYTDYPHNPADAWEHVGDIFDFNVPKKNPFK